MVSFDHEILLLSWQPCKYLKSYIDEIYLLNIHMPNFVYMLLVALWLTEGGGEGGGGQSIPLVQGVDQKQVGLGEG